MLQKSKSQYDSNTIRTYLLSNGIDEYNDSDDLTQGITPERLDEIAKTINPKIGHHIADVQELNALMGETSKPIKYRTGAEVIKTKFEVDERWDYNNYEKYFTKSNMGDLKNEDIEYLAEILPTRNELVMSQKLLARARRKGKIDFSINTVDAYEMAASVITDYGSNMGIEDLTTKLIDYVDAMNLTKFKGQW